MADIAIFRINYKSDFIITLESDAGWTTPFCIKFWTDSPQRAFYVQYDGETYTHCAPVAGEPTKLSVQMDDHHLGVGDLKYQIAYHFTVADFPDDTEDEVLNQAAVIINEDGQQEQVMLDLQGETAPEIAFSLPAYANEAQRIENEEQRIANETERVIEFAEIKTEAVAATNAANAAASLANEKAQLADDKAQLADSAASLATAKAQLAQEKATYAQMQGDYAKAQGDYAKAQGDTAQADHVRAEADHTTAAADHTTAASDHTQAATDHATATSDHAQAGSDHTRAESDHTRAESDHAAVEVYVDSLGAFDISAYHATGGVLAKYADLTAALGTNGANIPDTLRKGGMSVKFVQSSDNKYVQYFLTKDEWSANAEDWEKLNLEEEVSQLGQDVNDISDILNGGEEEIKTLQTPLSTSGYINCSMAQIGQAYNRTIVVSYEGAACWRIPVSIGEKYEIWAKGNGNAGALYVLTGNNDIVLAKVGNSESKTTPVILNITQNGFLYVNDIEYSTSPGNVYKVTTQYNDGLIERVEELEESEVEVADNLTTSDATKALSAKQGVVLDGRLTNIENEINGTPTTETITYAPQGIGSYINSSNTSVGDTFNKAPKSGSTQGYANYKVPVQSGDVVSIYGYGNNNSAKLYVLTNSQNIIVAMVGDKNTHITPEVLNIEADGWVYVNDLDYSVEVGKVVIQRAAYTESLEDRMKDYTDEQVASVERLSGKTILIFGDSMSTARDSQSKTYADYVAEKTGAIIKNIAIGGTRFSQRYEPTLTPDTANAAYANLDICNMVYAVCENDFRYADAAVTKLNRYGDIIALAKTIIPADIDIIILEGGGNDYLNGHNLGVTDSIDKNTTLGALNYMIQKLSTTFPKAKIIGESNQVLYSNPPAFSATESYVVDDIVIYNPGSGYLRYKFINNHSGAWDSNDVVEINNLEWRVPKFWSDNDERIGGLTFRELIAEFEKRFNFYHIPYANMYETMGWNEYNFSSHYPDTDNHHPNDMKNWSEHLIGYLEKL